MFRRPLIFKKKDPKIRQRKAVGSNPNNGGSSGRCGALERGYAAPPPDSRVELFPELMVLPRVLAFVRPSYRSIGMLGGCQSPNFAEEGSKDPPAQRNWLYRNYRSVGTSVITRSEAMAAFPPEGSKQTIQWSAADATSFRTRVGPNYKKNGKKAPSTAALYDLVGIRMFTTAESFETVAEYLPKPSMPADVQSIKLPPHVPRFLFVTWNFPMAAPTIMKTPTSGPTFLLVFIFVIKASTAMHLADSAALSQAPPALRLLDFWYREVLVNGKENLDVKGRFKAIASVGNIDSVNLNSFAKSYNAKPVLVKKTGFVTRGGDYIEVSVNVFKWSYQARLGFNQCIATFAEALLDVGFVIEGRDDPELPEVILGCGRVCNPTIEGCESWPPVVQATQPMTTPAGASVAGEAAAGVGGGAADEEQSEAMSALSLADSSQSNDAASESRLGVLSKEQGKALCHGT